MERQVFQTNSKSRWKRFKASIILILTLFLLLLIVFIISFWIDRSPNIPFKEDYSSVIMAKKPYLKSNTLSNEYEGFRRFLEGKKFRSNDRKWHDATTNRMRRYNGNNSKYIAEWSKKDAGIRSAFYVSWDPMSYASLKTAISSLNLVIPEWYFLDPKTCKIVNHTDNRGYQLMKRAGIPVMPMLSNAWNGSFNPKGIHRILHNNKLRVQVIDSMLVQCLRNKFVGINVDLEELQEPSNDELTSFIAQLSHVFHDHGLLVTQDIAPGNEDYDVASLVKYDDYLMLMAYDQYNTLTGPGPVSASRWIETQIDALGAKVPEQKIILGIAAYGYDWNKKGDDNESVTFNDAMSVADDTGSSINFDDDTYCLNYAYRDNIGQMHQVYFNDAATNFNTMRFGCEYHIAGFGVWRLGSEDQRLWSFYNKDLSRNGVTKLHIGDLEILHASHVASYLGSGEVMNVINTPHDGKVNFEIDNHAMLIAEENYIKIPTAYDLQKFGHCGKKELLLTFDDGPDSRWTPSVLHTLKKYHVHAAFFMVGIQMEKNLPWVKRVFDAGNLIGDHTFTHHNVAENSPQRTYAELRLTRLLLESCTGYSTVMFRAPYNADSDPSGNDELLPLAEARKQNFIDIGEAVDPNDWQPGVTADQIYHRVIDGVEKGDGHIILLHDAGGETRKPTITALPHIIKTLQKKGYKFITLDQYLGRSRAQLMPAIPKGKEYYIMQANLTLAEFIYNFSSFIDACFILFLLLGLARLVFMWFLMLKETRHKRHIKKELEHNRPNDYPLVSIIIPAYNEEVDCLSSIEAQLQQDYPNYNIVFVDDGSKDRTYTRVVEAYGDNPKVKILTKENGGKATALNYGIENTNAEFVVCVDADTKLRSNALSLLMDHFFADTDKKVGAVAGNVKVGNECNVLTCWQAIEYTTSQNFDRMAYSSINAITVVPGAIGAYRRQAIVDAGGLQNDTLAEDCDLTIRILRVGYRIENENDAIAMTEVPEKLGQFIKQRTRWCFGIMQTFWKNRDVLFNKKYKGLGLWALPNMLVFQFIIPTFSPFADVLMILGLFTGNLYKVLLYYGIFLLIDGSLSIMAYIREHDNLWKLLLIIPQRLCYRWIMYIFLFKSYKKAIKGELQSWGVLKRTGNVRSVK